MADCLIIDLDIAPVDAGALGPAGVEGLLDELLAFYAAVQAVVAGTDNDPRWVVGTHPSREELAQAAADGGLVVGRAGDRLVGAFVMDGVGAPGYEDVSWTVDAGPDEAAVIHLLAVHPDFRGRGMARLLMAAAADIARERGKRALRLDTLVANEGAQRTYERLGFRCLGPHRLAYGPYPNPVTPNFVLYELLL